MRVQEMENILFILARVEGFFLEHTSSLSLIISVLNGLFFLRCLQISEIFGWNKSELFISFHVFQNPFIIIKLLYSSLATNVINRCWENEGLSYKILVRYSRKNFLFSRMAGNFVRSQVRD